MPHILSCANDNGKKYLKEVDTKDMVLHFTDYPSEAKRYSNEWFADTELEFIKFHFKDNENAKQLVREYI